MLVEPELIEIKNKFKAVIFDMDGTIIDTEQVWKMITFKMLEHHHVEYIPEDHIPFFESLSGIGLVEAVVALREYFNITESIDQMIIVKKQIANDHFAANIPFIGGFESFHAFLRSHSIPTSLATNASVENLQEINRKLKLTDFFGNHLYCPADVNNKTKPDPAMFIHAAEQLGVKPEQCVVFEDSIYGFRAAQAAGMKCIAIKNTINKPYREFAQGAIDDYSQALEQLKKV